MEFGAMKCIFCRRVLPITDEYPWVGAVLQCSMCKGFQVIMIHQLNHDMTVSFGVSPLPSKYLRKLNEILNENK